MIDLDDLQNIRICRKCNHLYMLEMIVDESDYERREYPENPRLCILCVKNEVEK